jgi:hypothetical protein
MLNVQIGFSLIVAIVSVPDYFENLQPQKRRLRGPKRNAYHGMKPIVGLPWPALPMTTGVIAQNGR